jgi:hypothetical protein
LFQRLRTGGSSSWDTYIPTLIECNLVKQSMDKGRGFGTTSSSTRLHHQLQVSPKWRRLVGMLNLRKITLLRYLFNAWYRRVLHWIECDLFLSLLEDFSKSDPWSSIVLSQMSHNSLKGTTFLGWCENGWKGNFRFPAELEIEDFRWILEQGTRNLLWCQRACKGLVSNRFFLRRLGHLLVKHRSESLGIKVKRGRKRGHTDHGSLPCNAAAREADRQGGNKEFQERLSTRLITWLNSLLPP